MLYMRRYNYPYNGKRYLLNTNTKEVHDLDNENSLCQINEIRTEHILMFDFLDSALNYPNMSTRNNNGCYWCLKEHHTN